MKINVNLWEQPPDVFPDISRLFTVRKVIGGMSTRIQLINQIEDLMLEYIRALTIKERPVLNLVRIRNSCNAWYILYLNHLSYYLLNDAYLISFCKYSYSRMQSSSKI